MSVSVDLRDPSPSVLHDQGPALLIGEIHTGMLQNSAPVPADVAEQLLARVANQRVRRWERPIRYAASPQSFTGVDCNLPATSGFTRRAVGTIATDAHITAAQLLQASAYTEVTRASESRRVAWSQYLTVPGSLQALGDVRPAEVVQGFLSSERPAQRTSGVLDLGGICGGVMAQVQRSALLDRGRPLRAARTRFRWTAVRQEGTPTYRLTIGPGELRTLELGVPEPQGEVLRDLCLDVARHDWLLSCVIEALDVANIGYRQRTAVVQKLQPIVDHLLHAWMPAARLDDRVLPIWEEIDRSAGYSRQWDTLMHRIRDQLSLAILEGRGNP